VLAGWFTAEIGRQPWVVYGLLRTRDAITPSLTGSMVALSLAGYVVVYAVIYSFGLYYIWRQLRDGPPTEGATLAGVTPARPLAVGVRRADAGE
jgi:cytochrome d ubiquinol oxidase subunit I